MPFKHKSNSERYFLECRTERRAAPPLWERADVSHSVRWILKQLVSNQRQQRTKVDEVGVGK